MGWSIGYDSRLKRDVGYGVPAYCDHPDCNEEIDRGLSYVCGSDIYGGEFGCGLHFCGKHLHYLELFEDDDRMVEVCERCLHGQLPFTPKSDHPDWIKHKMTDPSWAEWREKNGIRNIQEAEENQTS